MNASNETFAIFNVKRIVTALGNTRFLLHVKFHAREIEHTEGSIPDQKKTLSEYTTDAILLIIFLLLSKKIFNSLQTSRNREKKMVYFASGYESTWKDR
jgi:hypothetical protein